MSRPPHADESDDMARILTKCIDIPTSKVQLFVLITVDAEGWPHVTGNLDTVDSILSVIRQVGGFGDPDTVREVHDAKDN